MAGAAIQPAVPGPTELAGLGPDLGHVGFVEVLRVNSMTALGVTFHPDATVSTHEKKVRLLSTDSQPIVKAPVKMLPQGPVASLGAPLGPESRLYPWKIVERLTTPAGRALGLGASGWVGALDHRRPIPGRVQCSAQ